MQNLVVNLYYVYAVILVGGGAMGSMVSKKPSSLKGKAFFLSCRISIEIFQLPTSASVTKLLRSSSSKPLEVCRVVSILKNINRHQTL